MTTERIDPRGPLAVAPLISNPGQRVDARGEHVCAEIARFVSVDDPDHTWVRVAVHSTTEPDDIDARRLGSDTIALQIGMEASVFLNPEQAATLAARLAEVMS